MSKIVVFCGVILSLLLVVAGCSDDPASPPPGNQGIRVDLDPGGADFSIEIATASTPDSLARGPFLLRGHNLHYNDVVGALVVDLTIRNDSPASFWNPVHITFLRLFPEGTFIVNSPDDGPTFEFDFANDDLWWTPGEESLPLTVMFKANLGVSVGFNAHISVGGIHLEGVISGRVWHDLNRNGWIDPDEPGLPNILIDLDDGGDEENLVRALTDAAGHYRFSDLPSGTYEVRVVEFPDGLFGTTPLNMHVLLTTTPDGVGSFTEANFGFAPPDSVTQVPD